MYVKLFPAHDLGQLRINHNKWGYLFIGTSYIITIEYVILTKIKVTKNELQMSILIS